MTTSTRRTRTPEEAELRGKSLRLAERLQIDPRTAERLLRGGSVLPVVRIAAEYVAPSLGIALP